MSNGLFRAPGVTASATDFSYDWSRLGDILSDGTDSEKADFLGALAFALHVRNDAVTLRSFATEINRNPEPYDRDSIIWFLSELLEQLEGELNGE